MLEALGGNIEDWANPALHITSFIELMQNALRCDEAVSSEMASSTLGHLSVYLDDEWPVDERSVKMIELIGFREAEA